MRSRAPEPDHFVESSDANVHSDWNNARDPVLRIDPGETVRFECRDALDGQIGPDTTPADLRSLDQDVVHPLTGPVAVEGAEPDHTLRVEILALSHEGWGFTAVMPGDAGKGLLPEDFEEPWLYRWELGDGTASFVDGIELPIDPFPGNIGVAPAESGPHSTVPPRAWGGNLDVKYLTAGSTLYLPVGVPDALFSVGDCHAAQGDGEVCVNGIEAPMDVTVRFDLVEDAPIDAPRYEAGERTAPPDTDSMFGTTGVDSDLMAACKTAVRGMIDHLGREYDLSPVEAYVLCSAAADLRVNEVVNAPNWVVSATIPASIFPD